MIALAVIMFLLSALLFARGANANESASFNAAAIFALAGCVCLR